MPKPFKRARETEFTGMDTLDDVKEAVRILISKQGDTPKVDIDISALAQEVASLLRGDLALAQTVAQTVTENSDSTSFSFRRVDNLPSISSNTPEIVIWNSPNGDDDFWVSKPGTAYWAPLAHFSNLDGTP